jgi:hypothetical protein
MYQATNEGTSNMLISVTFGNETFQQSSAKYQLFACRSALHTNIEPQQKHLWIACRDADASIQRHGGLNVVPAAPGYRTEMGKWSTAQYDAPEGLVIKLFGQRKLAEMVTGRHTNASVYLMIREEAALVRVVGRLTGDPRATGSEIVMFEGRADVLSLQDVADAGVLVHGQHAAQSEDYNVNTLFTVTELSPEISGRVTVAAQEIENTQGETRRVVTPRRRRAIQV